VGQVNATRAFLGDEAEWARARIELNDLQALWGGRLIRVDGAGNALVRIVQPGLMEFRYEFGVSPAEWTQLLESFLANDFLSIVPEERPGIPDEARPQLVLVNARGQEKSVAKWAGVQERRFEAIYQTVGQLQERIDHLEPIWHGPYLPAR
jgi:hypothetical protein